MTASLAAAHVCEARVGWAALKRHNASISVPTNETSPWQADSNLTSYVHRHRRELGDLSGWLDGRSTWYGGPSGPGPDGMSILKGSCGYGAKLRNHFVAAAQTMGGYNWGLTGECGRCYEVMCVHGKTRGTAGSSLGPWEGCLDAGRRSVVVQITDSCPCFHPNGGSNKRWCAAMTPDQHAMLVGQCPDVHQADTRTQVLRRCSPPGPVVRGLRRCVHVHVPGCAFSDR